MHTDKPTVTPFGSCRVFTPCTLLAKSGRLYIDQANIFGYTHYTSEVLQQIDIVTARKSVPSRLRPYLNIPSQWQNPDTAISPRERFPNTDLFIVEISSIRKILFKAMFLQINRTREILVKTEAVLKQWWRPLLLSNINRIDVYQDLAAPDPVQMEVAAGLTIIEQTVDSIRHDAERIIRILGKPVLFVSHFNTDMKGEPIPQRSRIVEALSGLGERGGFFDPSAAVQSAGPEAALTDISHYAVEFETEIARLLEDKITALL